jgi:hypothetical protein
MKLGVSRGEPFESSSVVIQKVLTNAKGVWFQFQFLFFFPYSFLFFISLKLKRRKKTSFVIGQRTIFKIVGLLFYFF